MKPRDGRQAGESARQRTDLPPAKIVRRRSRKATWLGWGLLLAGLLVIGGWSAVTGVELFGHARSLQSHLQSLEALTQGDAGRLEAADLQSIGPHLAGMRQDLAVIRSRLGPLLPAGRLLRWVPGYGADLAAASDLLEMAAGTTSAADRTFQALSPALDLLAGSKADLNPATSMWERLLPALVAAQPELQVAQRELAAVEQARARIETQALSPRAAALLARLDRYLPWLATAANGVLLAPDLLAADGPRTYLVVAQNNHELRATGGFISGVGELRVEGGRLVSLRFQDNYAVDNLAVPHELTPPDLQRVFLGQLWLFRDTNWDPDFPTSARRALDVYARDQGVQADGVITLDLTALQLLVEAVGPLQVEGITEAVTGENILPVIQKQWGEPAGGSGQEWWLHRKDFMGQIAGAVMDRLATLPRDAGTARQESEQAGVRPVTSTGLSIGRLAQAIKQALDEKHILLYLTDLQAAGLLRDRNWDGALRAPASPSNVLLVVDSNVGFNKADARIDRSIHYQVDLSAEGGPRARLTLTYQHRSARPVGDCIQEARYGDEYADMMDRCYWAYVRVYVPAGSRLLAWPDLPLPAGSLLVQSGDVLPSPAVSPTLTQGDWSVWTAFFDLPTLEERTLTFDYRLPAGVLDYDPDGLIHYRLRIQKQPGTEAVPLRVEITLPPNAELIAGLPDMDTDLRTDREFEIAFRGGQQGP